MKVLELTESMIYQKLNYHKFQMLCLSQLKPYVKKDRNICDAYNSLLAKVLEDRKFLEFVLKHIVSSRDREIITLRYLKNFSTNKVSKVLSLSKTTIVNMSIVAIKEMVKICERLDIEWEQWEVN